MALQPFPAPLAKAPHKELLNAAEGLFVRVQTLEAENEWLRQRLNLASHALHGQSSEATTFDQTVLALLFDEAEVTAVPEAPEPTEEETVVCRKRKGQRESKLKDLPVEEIRYELPEAERVCPACCSPLHEMGEECRRELKLVPAQASFVDHIQVKYACRHCPRQHEASPVLTAPMPIPAFPGSLASPSAVAFILSQKYELGLPLYRQEQYLKGLGLNLSRQTLSNWVIWSADWFKPMFRVMRIELLGREVLHADETRLQVLHEPNREAKTTSYMWVCRSGRDGPPLVLYDYRPTRGAEHPQLFFKGFKGYLHVDGYAAYDNLPGVTLVGCWAHARRKFHNILVSLGPGQNSGLTAQARQGLTYCDRLFKIESELRECTPEVRLDARLKRCQPVLNEMHAWLVSLEPKVMSQSVLGQAIGYCLRQWPKLLGFLKDGRLEIDNNRCERAVKPFVIGRKNWLFSNTPGGARASSLIYSMVESAKENGLRPAAYLEYLLHQLPQIDPNDTAAMHLLMPWNPNVQEACK